jgi:hypothetical protein
VAKKAERLRGGVAEINGEGGRRRKIDSRLTIHYSRIIRKNP